LISQYFRSRSCPGFLTCFLILLMQQTLASFAPRQNGMQAPPTAAVPPHLQAQSSRTGTPQFSTPPPGAFGMGAPRAGPPGYPSSYASGSGGTPVSIGHYNAPPAPQATNQNIPAALAAIPENQRVSNSLGVWDNNTEQCE
jgi:cleavage stimulation factor subunit 2